MGAESFGNEAATGQRQAKRARVLLAARLQTAHGDVEARLRDLSRKGALLECRVAPPAGTEVVFVRGSTCVPARVAWSADNRVGLEFAYMIDEQEVLVQLGHAGSDRSSQRFRRPRLFGESMSEQDRKVARRWGASVGIAVPGE